METLGSITLLGSGETASTGGQVFEALAAQHRLKGHKYPLQVSILETPAGFEVNAQRVAGRVADFVRSRLQNEAPLVYLIAARKKSTRYSPDAPEVVRPLLSSQIIFFGPGSPTYTIRQLQDSLAWHFIQARQRLGASLVLASAAIISIGDFALPIYEIYKAGEDPHWVPGLGLFKPFGLCLAIVPHWNNNEGGSDVDTSRCFMGQDRFAELLAMLPPEVTLLGLDEHTSLTVDFETQTCFVRGSGQVHLTRGESQQDCSAGCSFSIFDLGNYTPLADPSQGLPEPAWQAALLAAQSGFTPEPVKLEAPSKVLRLVEERQQARKAKDWALADQIRGQITRLGWQVIDTASGPLLQREE